MKTSVSKESDGDSVKYYKSPRYHRSMKRISVGTYCKNFNFKSPDSRRSVTIRIGFGKMKKKEKNQKIFMYINASVAVRV